METILKAHDMTVRVQDHGAMTTAEFPLQGRRVDPFYRAPWNETDCEDSLLRYLRGDFLCAPFGARPAAVEALEEPWRTLTARASADAYAHGAPANHTWRVRCDGADRCIAQTENLPWFSAIERTVSCTADHHLTIADRLEPCGTFRLPMGLHPIFRLPETPGAAALRLPSCDGIRTFPGDMDHVSQLVPDQALPDLTAVTDRQGRTWDLTHLPLPLETEELVLLHGVREGRVALENRAEGYRVVLRWDADQLPNCLLWISNRGRNFAPWNGRNLCLGIEPIAAAFDLGVDVSCGDNPLQQQGAVTAMAFTNGKPVTIAHEIYVESI